MLKGRKFLKTIFTVLVIFCFSITALAGYFYVNNVQEINRILQVGLIVKTQFLHQADTKQLLKGAVRGMVESLNDPYSVFMDAQEFKDMQRYIQGSIGGIGIYIGAKDKKIIVIAPIEGTPAFRAGIQRDDVIIKINDTYTSDIDADQAVAMMRGDPGTQVRVTTLRGDVSQEYTLTREIIDIPTVESKVLAGGIGYLQIKLFASNTDESVTQHLKKLTDQGMKALVIDLRDDPGGDLESAVNIAKNFIPKGPIVYIVDRGGKAEPFAEAEGDNLKIPLAVLINGGSASASEVLSGAIKDTGSGTLIGEKTFGKGIVQGVFPLANGEGLKLTTSKYLTPNKTDIHEKGIEPDILVKPSPDGKKDLQLEKAVALLQAKIK